MSKEIKIPIGRNANLPLREGQIKIPDPMASFFDFIVGMDHMRPGSNFMNFHVEGSFVTFYMTIDAKLYYESILTQKGYKCEHTMLNAMERGYPANDFYFRCGPYEMRLSITSEFRDRQKRMLEGDRI
jgi:hypothetical protein